MRASATWRCGRWCRFILPFRNPGLNRLQHRSSSSSNEILHAETSNLQRPTSNIECCAIATGREFGIGCWVLEIGCSTFETASCLAMRILPIVRRELRVAARRRGTYWLRSGVALGVVIAATWIFLMSLRDPPREVGPIIFYVLTGTSLLYCLL